MFLIHLNIHIQIVVDHIYRKGKQYMESRNLEAALLHTNIMMDVNRGLDEIEPLFDDDPVFLEDEDADEFFAMATEFDYLKQAFARWEYKYENDSYVDMLELDKIANYLDVMRCYLESINKPF